MRSAGGTAGRPSHRSGSPRCRVTCSMPAGAWPSSLDCAGTSRWPTISSDAPSPCARRSRPASGCPTSASTRWRSAPTGRPPTRSPQTPATACGAASVRPIGPAPSLIACSAPGCSPAGGSARSRPASRASTRSATTPARSGRTTRRSRRRVCGGTGFDEEANRLATALFEAAEHFQGYRLPELFCGFDRASTSVPVAYPVACSPQAWAAGAPYLLLQSMLGLEAHADRRELELRRPHLPTWLSRVTLTNVRVGDAAVDLLFHRWRGTTSAEVLRKVGDVSVTIRL